MREGFTRARGDRVAIYLDNSATVVIGIYAALRAGAAFVVINPQTKEDKLRYILADCGAVALVADGLGFHIPRAYIYFSMAFAALVEMFNVLARRGRRKQAEG